MGLVSIIMYRCNPVNPINDSSGINNESKNISNITGNIDYSYGFRDAINNGLICDYNIYVPDITTKKEEYINNIYKEINLKQIDSNFDVMAMFLLRSLDENNFFKCISYFSNHESANRFKNSLLKMNENYQYIALTVDVITSNTSTRDMKRIINQFAIDNRLYIICSVQILDECIDIRECDSIFLSKEVKSEPKLIQRICRSNKLDKKKPNKKAGIFMWCDEFNDMTKSIMVLKAYDKGFSKEKIKIVNYIDEETDSIIDRIKYEKKYLDIDNYITNVLELLTSNKSYNKLIEQIK